jgi:hypothetical protein
VAAVERIAGAAFWAAQTREDGEELARKFQWDVAVPGEH